MTPRLLKRLDLIAAAAESQSRDEISRLTANLAEIAASRALLATYRGRLSQSWQNGVTGSAAAAQRAEIFCAAARQADEQIIAREQQWQTQRAAALQTLNALQTKRDILKRYYTEAAREAATLSASRLEKDQPARSQNTILR